MKFFLILLLSTACSKTTPNSERGRLSNSEQLLSPQMTRKLITGQSKAPKTEAVKSELKSQVKQWWYGHGVGRTVTNVAAIVVFPPWGLYLLANAGVALAGYEPVYISDALPEKTKSSFLEVYDGVTSVPGRVNATIAGEKFHSSPSIKEKQADEKNRDRSKINSFASKAARSRNY